MRIHVFHNKFRMIIFNVEKTFSSNFKCSRSQIFFNIGVLFEKIYLKENPPQLFSCKHCEIFKSTYSEMAPSALVMIYYNHKVSNYVLGTYRQKHNVEWFLLRRFLDLVRDIRILTGLDDRFCFCLLLNVYFSDKPINGWQIF